MDKPILLTSLVFTDSSGKPIVSEEFSMKFTAPEDLEAFIQSRYSYWKDLLEKELKIAPRYGTTIQESDITRIFMEVARSLRIPQRMIFKRTREPKVIEARRMAIGICTELYMSLTDIANAINMNHATILHHRNKFYDLCKIEKGYEEKYTRLKDAVLKSINGEYNEDGSGEKISIEQ